MYYIHGGRAAGKTAYLIAQSATGKVPIMVTTYVRKKYIQDQAKWLGVSIPEPVVWNPGAHVEGLRVREVLIDDGEDFLRYVMFHTARAEAVAIAISEPVMELPVKHMANLVECLRQSEAEVE